MTARSIAKRLAYSAGAMNCFHRFRHRHSLTVVMLHRVLPTLEGERRQADPLYSITPELLAECVDFFKRNYTIVSLGDVLRSRLREKPLPVYPLLITFDDGWRDNLDWALPVLAGLPWVLFAATDALSNPHCWWQEVLLWSIRSRRATLEELRRHIQVANEPVWHGSHELEILERYARLPEKQRQQVLSQHEYALRGFCDKPQMLSWLDLRTLIAAGVEIGGHGAAHIPLSLCPDPALDLKRAQHKFRLELGESPPRAMSFPHGRYNICAINAARAVGYQLIFTSDPILNHCPNGWLQSDVIGRIYLTTQSVSYLNGRLAPHRLAAWLYTRSSKILDSATQK